MIVVLILIALILYLIVEIFRYQKVKANAFSKKEVAKAADEHARKLSYADPVISCDYCGSKIDTRKQKICPQCGATYDRDSEWIVRHGVEEEFIDKGTRELIAAREKKAAEESGKILKRIRKTILIIVALIVLLLAVAGIREWMSYLSEFRKTEELNDKNSYHTYSPADYQPVGDGVIYDEHDVKISVTGFYVDVANIYDSDSYGTIGSVKVGFHVENNCNKPVEIMILSNGYNGVAGEDMPIYTSAFYRPGDYVVYEEILNVPKQQISEIMFNNIRIQDRDYEFHYELSEPLILKTTSTYEQKLDYDDGTLFFTNDQIDIYCRYEQEEYSEGYRFYAINKTENSFIVNGPDVTVDGKSDIVYGFTDVYLPTNYIFRSRQYHARYGKEGYEDMRNFKVETSLSFRCNEDPSLSFETPYLELR